MAETSKSLKILNIQLEMRRFCYHGIRGIVVYSHLQKYGNPTECEEEFQDYSEDDFSKLLLNLQSPADIRLPRTC